MWCETSTSADSPMPVLCNKFIITIENSSLYTWNNIIYILILILLIFNIILIYYNYCPKIKKLKNKYNIINNNNESAAEEI